MFQFGSYNPQTHHRRYMVRLNLGMVLQMLDFLLHLSRRTLFDNCLKEQDIHHSMLL